MPRTLGSPCFFPIGVGSISTPRTAAWPIPITLRWLGGAITTMYRPCAAFSSAAGHTKCGCRLMSSPRAIEPVLVAIRRSVLRSQPFGDERWKCQLRHTECAYYVAGTLRVPSTRNHAIVHLPTSSLRHQERASYDS